jgi:general secretion pathway protein K
MISARRQSGVALIMAILIVALATILAVSAATEGYMDQRRNFTAISMDQAYEVGLGGEALAADALQQDSDAKQDTLAESWATPITLPLDDGIGEIKGQLEDLQGRFNLNSVLNQDGSHNAETIEQFKRLLTLLSIDPKFANMWVDWVDADQTEEFPDGAEDTAYAGQTTPHLTANMPVTRVSELMTLPNFTLADFRKLEPHVAALPLDAKLNVCTATPEVIDSLKTDGGDGRDFSTPEGIRNITENRAKGCFPTANEVRTAFNSDAGFAKLLAKHADYLVETTSYFRANILVTLGTTELALYSVMHRLGTGSNAKVQVIQRSFGTQ